MCGINGIFSPGRAHLMRSNVESMNRVLGHRGPDDSGIYSDDNIQLGHLRLSIIDLSAMGHQPMMSDDGSIAIVFNGEIYNFVEIRESLAAKGHYFKSQSDTEVILRGYQEWGIDIIGRLEGMFAIALWDRKEKSLFLVRDGCGVKPMYYAVVDGALVFSSELKGVLASGLVERKLDLQSLSNYLSMYYVPSPGTPLESVRQLEAGTILHFQTSLVPHKKKFWDLPLPPATLSGRNLHEQIRAEARIAVNASLISDVPMCLLLSSGIDSAIILYELAQLGRTDIETVSIGFKDSSYDESGMAIRLANHFGFKNNRIIMEETGIEKNLEKSVYHLDMLNGNPCILAEYLYYQEVARNYKVALMGSGNDELFAGYMTYIADRYRTCTDYVPTPIKWLGKMAADQLPASDRKYSFDYLAQKFFEGIFFEKGKSHYWWRSIFSDVEKEQLLQPELLRQGIKVDSYYVYEELYERAKPYVGFPDQTLYGDFHRFLIDNANMSSDQLSMAFSIEARHPFLTKRFAGFAFSVPFNEKLKRNVTKACLRDAYRGLLPPYVINKKKQGIVAPLHFLKSPAMRDYVLSHLLSKTMERYFVPSVIERLYNENLRGKRTHSYRLFALLCFSIWHVLFLANPIQPSDNGGAR